MNKIAELVLSPLKAQFGYPAHLRGDSPEFEQQRKMFANQWVSAFQHLPDETLKLAVADALRESKYYPALSEFHAFTQRHHKLEPKKQEKQPQWAPFRRKLVDELAAKRKPNLPMGKDRLSDVLVNLAFTCITECADPKELKIWPGIFEQQKTIDTLGREACVFLQNYANDVISIAIRQQP